MLICMHFLIFNSVAREFQQSSGLNLKSYDLQTKKESPCKEHISWFGDGLSMFDFWQVSVPHKEINNISVYKQYFF